MCRSACTPTRRLEELSTLRAVEAEVSTLSTWSGTLVGIFASVCGLFLMFLLGSFTMKRYGWSSKALQHKSPSLATNLVQGDRVFPDLEDDASEAEL